MDELTPETRECVQLMLDVFSADGAAFMQFRWALGQFEKEAETKEASRKLLKIVHDFGRLLKAVTK